MITKYDTEKASVVVFWQEPKDEPVGEPAISMKAYSDCLCLCQEANSISVTLECVPEFIKAIKKAMEPEP